MAIEERKCQCGRVWRLAEHKVSTRDKDTLECKCGRVIISWNGGVIYTAELVGGEKT